MKAERVSVFLHDFTEWARTRPDILAAALVGSYARSAAGVGSDVDLVIIASQPEQYLADQNWAAQFGDVRNHQLEDYGKLTSVRISYGNGLEVEYGITDEGWAAFPLDEGTRQVISDGMVVLCERGDILSRYQAPDRSAK